MALFAACASDSNAQIASARADRAAEDSVSVAWLLRAVRGADPLLCELAVRQVDMQGSWSNWGSIGDNPLETDSAAAAVIKWTQQEHDDPAMVPALTAAMRDPDACVRRVGGSFLGRVKHVSARAALLSGLDDGNPETRYVAAMGLGLGGVTDAQQPLTRRLRDDSPKVRRAAAWALGALEQTSALPALIETLARDSDPRVRQAAAWAIGRSHE